jgi:HEPN domain-containing protein
LAARTRSSPSVKRYLEHARHSPEGGGNERARFAAQQAAEKAFKALHRKAGAEAWGHSILALPEALPEPLAADKALEESGKELDKHCIPARCPNSYPQGSPHEYQRKMFEISTPPVA